MWKSPYHGSNMHAKWTLIHLRGIIYFRALLWSQVQNEWFDPLSIRSENELWSTWFSMQSLVRKWTRVHFSNNLEVDQIVHFEPVWSEKSPKVCDSSQVDQSSFRMHIKHMIRSPSHILLDQGLCTRGNRNVLAKALVRNSLKPLFLGFSG